MMALPAPLLADQQSALLSALFCGANASQSASKNIAAHVDSTGTNGLFIYKNNALALSVRVLQAAYPVLAQFLGDDNFEPLAQEFWCQCPPQRGDLAQWGDRLPSFVAAHAQLADEPFLGDVAALEWALHCSATGADRDRDPASFAVLMAHDPGEIRLQLAPGTAVLASPWPIVSLWQAHQPAPSHTDLKAPLGDQSDAKLGSDLQAVSELLQQRVGQTAIIWRDGHQPRVREALPGEAGLLQALLAGQSLGAALQEPEAAAALLVDAADATKVSAALDFGAWLPMAVQTGLLLSASRREAVP